LFGGYVIFFDNATANNASFLNKGSSATNAPLGGITDFLNTSTAGNSTIVNEGATGDGYPGLTQFYDETTAGTATITNNGSAVNGTSGGSTIFHGDSNASAGSATLIANGGSNGGGGGVIQFGSLFHPSATDGGTARIKIFGNGTLDVTNQYAGVTVGSIEGTGLIAVGGQNLTVGSNNLSTTFSGLIKEQGDIGGYQGTFSKIGSGTLTIEGIDNNHIGDSLTLGLNTGSPVNLNFTGAADTVLSLIVDGVLQAPGLYGSAASGAPHQLPQLTGSGRLFVRARAVSRKTHGGVPFDIPLRFNRPAAVECRSGGVGGNYQMVVTFANPATFTGAGVTDGNGSVGSATGSGTTTITVNLVNVTDGQTITVTLLSVNDGTTTANLQIPMSVLIGDTNGNGSVNASDITQTKVQSGQQITASNFREDVNGNGAINASDVALVKSKSGTSLP
jgi:hypothetical protein